MAVPSFDPFANATGNGGTGYEVGGNLVGQYNSTLFGPWYLRGGNFGSTQPTIVAGNLSYSGLPPSSGNGVLFGPDPLTNSMSACIDLNLPAVHTETVYYSFLLKITDVSAVPTYATNNPVAAFLDDPSLGFTGNQIGRLGSRLLTRKVGDGYVLGISRSAVIADFVYEPDEAAHNVNDVLFVVGCYQREAGVQTNVNLWVNPAASSFGSNEPPPPTLVAPHWSATTGAINNNSARAFGILCQFPHAPGGVIDDVRVATTWEYATGSYLDILEHPVSLALPPGHNASFSVVAEGTPPLTYQWIKDGSTVLTDGGNISGAQTATLTISGISAADVGSYDVYVTNFLGNFLLSGSASLALADPGITGQPESRTNDFGTTATFQVTATGTAPFTYQWHKAGSGDLSDGGNISGSHSSALTLSSVSYLDAGSYYVTVSNALGAATVSATADLTVNDPVIVTQPVSVTNMAGSNVTFQVVADGSPTLFYQWLKGGNILFDGGNISGANTDTLAISNISPADAGNYSVQVIGASSIASSAAALVVITAIPPNPRTVAAGSKAVFAVGVNPTALGYQWMAHGTNIPGATSFAYTVANAQAADAGSYSVIVSHAINTQTYTTTLTVEPSLQLYRTNLVVVSVGDGAQAQTLNGNSMFLHQFKPDGSYVNTVNIPDDGPSGMTAAGLDNVNGINNGSTTGTSLTRSLDDRFMVVAGYNTNLHYGANLINSLAASVPRGIGFIDSYAQYTLAMSSPDPALDATYWRGAVTDGTNNFWGVSGKAGTYYFGFDAAPGSIQTTFLNNRSVGLFNGNIYCAGAVSGSEGVLKIDGMPMTAITPTHLFTGSSGTYDLAVSPDGNLIYVADQRATANGGGVQRWEFDGSNWNLAYTLTDGFGTRGPRYVTADFSGANPVLYATSNDSSFDNNRIVKVVDAGAGSVGTTLTSAGANQTLRGIAFGPIENPVVPQPVLSFIRDGNELILNWTGAFILQSAILVTGPYSDVTGATSPHTNNIGAGPEFFRLRN